eukprot:c18492_g1_i1.p1 GENE.c18492_g1_i1~~c18492_g1_i1.p1  ORF type:complete len:350 (+),score=95.47 c18492_g1_i1:28-1050(+)
MGKKKKEAQPKDKREKKKSGKISHSRKSSKCLKSDVRALSYQEALRMNERLRPLNLELSDVESDGNCLFRAIADQLEGDESLHKTYRQKILEFIRTNREDFEFFIEDDEPFDDYLQRMADNAEWGGQLEITAASRLFSVDVVIHQLDLPDYEMRAGPQPTTKQIHLFYVTDLHYASVRPIKPSTVSGPPNTNQIEPSSIHPETPLKASKQANSGKHKDRHEKPEPPNQKLFANTENRSKVGPDELVGELEAVRVSDGDGRKGEQMEDLKAEGSEKSDKKKAAEGGTMQGGKSEKRLTKKDKKMLRKQRRHEERTQEDKTSRPTEDSNSDSDETNRKRIVV